LRDAIRGALAVPYDVLDGSNDSVGTGLVGRAAIEVAEGRYKILVHVPGSPVTIQDVHVSNNKNTTVELGKQGDKITSRIIGP